MSIKISRKQVRINVLLDSEERKKYKLFCIKNNQVMSERIRELIKEDMKSNA